MIFLRRARHVASIVALLLSVCSSAYSQPPKQPEPSQAKTKAASQNQQQAQTPMQVTITAPEKTPEEKKAEIDRANRQDATNNRIAEATDRMATFSLYLVVVGALQLLATAMAAGITLRAANAAKVSADAAEHSAAIADQSLKTIQRPFVSVRGWRFMTRWDDSKIDGKPTNIRYFITPVLMNSGATPTKHATLRVQYKFRDAKLPSDYDFPYEVTAKGVVLGPQAELNCATGGLTAAELARIQSRKGGELYVWGEITYRDEFTDTPIHALRFCYKVTGVLGDPMNPRTPTNPDGTDVAFTMFMHNQYNEAT